MECVTDYAIFFLDAQGRVAAWNAGAERIFGYSESEIVGQWGGPQTIVGPILAGTADGGDSDRGAKRR